MSEAVREASETAPSELQLPGADILRRFQTLLTTTFSCLVIYSFMVASRAGSTGGFSESGGYFDSAGNPTDVVPMSYSLNVHPSPVVYLAVALAVLWTIPKIFRRAQYEEQAFRLIRRAQIIVMSIVFGSILITTAWFLLTSSATYGGTNTLFFPFPFAAVDFHTEPMSTP